MQRLSIIRFIIFSIVLTGFTIGTLLFRDKSMLVVVFSLSAYAFFVAVATYYYLRVLRPLFIFEKRLFSLAGGALPDAALAEGEGSVETSGLEKAMKANLQRQNEILAVVSDLAEGKVLDSFRSQGAKDIMGEAIIKLRNSIYQTQEESEKRRIQDEQQNWVSRGLANFGNLYRETGNNPEEFAGQFTGDLVKYLGVEVGGLFMMKSSEEGVPEYHLTGAYAFDREKYISKVFLPGEGLVGRCALEKESIYITDVPDDYIRIRSGMGEDKPSCLLLVPVILDDKVLGIIELGAFNKIPSYKQQFVKSLAASIASVLAKNQF